MIRITTLFLILAATICASARTGVKWFETTHNFGAFDEDSGPVTANFTLLNTGDEPIQILAARASCGCTSPKYTRKPIAPGDTTSIAVTYDPAGRPGKFTKYVGVELSGGLESVKLYVTGTVVGSPKSIQARFPADAGDNMSLSRSAVMFGQMKKGTTRTFNLTAYNKSKNAIHPVIGHMPPYISADIVPQEVPAGDQVTFILYFNSTKCPLYGLVADTLAISTGVAQDQPFLLPVTAMVEEDFSKLSPKQLHDAPVATLSDSNVDFGKIDRSTPLSASVTIKNTGKSRLTVRRVYSSDPGVSASISKSDIKPGKDAVIDIKVDPAKIPGDILNYRIAIITNDPVNPTQTIRLLGQ